MSVEMEFPGAERLKMAEQLFVVLDGISEVRRARDEGADSPVIGFSRLYAYAVRPDDFGDEELTTALARDPALWSDFQRLLSRTSIAEGPQVAAAATGDIMSREGEGFRIDFRRRRAEPDQTYVILTLDDDYTARPEALLLLDSEQRICRKHILPVPRDGVIQILVERDSALLAELLDIKTTIFLV